MRFQCGPRALKDLERLWRKDHRSCVICVFWIHLALWKKTSVQNILNAAVELNNSAGPGALELSLCFSWYSIRNCKQVARRNIFYLQTSLGCQKSSSAHDNRDASDGCENSQHLWVIQTLKEKFASCPLTRPAWPNGLKQLRLKLKKRPTKRKLWSLGHVEVALKIIHLWGEMLSAESTLAWKTIPQDKQTLLPSAWLLKNVWETYCSCWTKLSWTALIQDLWQASRSYSLQILCKLLYMSHLIEIYILNSYSILSEVNWLWGHFTHLPLGLL